MAKTLYKLFFSFQFSNIRFIYLFFVSVLPGPSEELRSFAPEHDMPDAPDTAVQLEDERSQGGQPLDRRVWAELFADELLRRKSPEQRSPQYRRRRSGRVDGGENYLICFFISQCNVFGLIAIDCNLQLLLLNFLNFRQDIKMTWTTKERYPLRIIWPQWGLMLGICIYSGQTQSCLKLFPDIVLPKKKSLDCKLKANENI